MPFSDNNWKKDSFISSQAIRNLIETKYTLIKEPVYHVSQTSRLFTVKENGVKLGFISSVSESFCEWCNRVRITAEGKLRTCLHGKHEVDLKQLLNKNENTEILETLRKAILNKQKGHAEFLSPNYKPPFDDRQMIRIGG